MPMQKKESPMTDANPSPLVHAGEADRYGGWFWREPRHGEHFRRCSHCGSIHPEDLVTIARGRVGWADRKYGWPHKFYVHVPNVNPDALFAVGASSSDDDEPPYPGWVRSVDLTPEQKAIMTRDGFTHHSSGWVGFGTRAEHFGKVYTVHLADPSLTDEVRNQAAAMCGLHFEFVQDGRISWRMAAHA